MDRLAEAVAAHLCRHRASACSDSHSTLRGAVEVVRSAGLSQAVYATPEGLAQYVRETEVVNWARPADNPTPQSPTAKNGALLRLFSCFRFCGVPKNGTSILPNAV
jgi:hypothetical protein